MKNIKKTKPCLVSTKNTDWFTVDGVKYLREDLVDNQMVSIMERIAKSIEVQTSFYVKWDKSMDSVAEMAKEIFVKYKKK